MSTDLQLDKLDLWLEAVAAKLREQGRPGLAAPFQALHDRDVSGFNAALDGLSDEELTATIQMVGAEGQQHAEHGNAACASALRWMFKILRQRSDRPSDEPPF